MKWYDRFIRSYPADPGVPNVLWYLAWEYEQRCAYDTAIGLYQKIGIIRKNDLPSEGALYRIGLCHYKSGHYTDACVTFTRLLEKYPDSVRTMSSHYWKAQSFFPALHDTLTAKREFTDIVAALPTDYYAYRSRTMLLALGDTVSFPVFDTSSGIAGAREWFKVITAASPESIKQSDSIGYETGKKLVLCGCSQIARMYLEPIELHNSDNLQLQFELAFLYKMANLPAESLRIARRLTWKIPVSYRASAPLALYTAYPLTFLDTIRKVAGKNAVDPLLVLGIMRQESVFDADIVSKAGAIGLLSLCPQPQRKLPGNLQKLFRLIH